MSAIERLLAPGWLQHSRLARELLAGRLPITELMPGQMVGAFRIERELARGGMGIVYLAARADGAYEQRVAIKWLPLGRVAGTATDQFRRERQILAELRHPHIARLLDGGCSDDGHLWFAMEHVEGEPVDGYVARTAPDWRQRIRLLLPVIDAVQFAHAHLLVHRDIKPDNVLIDAEGHALLIDFGIAALVDEATAQCAYTAGHASPEQKAGALPDTAIDIWQLGHLLRTVLATPTAGRAQQLPRDLDAILARATHALPAHRYPTAAALQADLERLLDHRPVSARHPGVLHRLQLLCRAHPVGVSASVAVVLAFLALTSGFMLRLAHQRDIANNARANAQAVNAFIENDMLTGADPLQAGSGNITVAEVARRALQQVEPRLHTMPQVAAQVELSLGETLASLGRFKDATRAFALALGHLTTLYGANNPRVLQARLERDKFALLDPSSFTSGRADLLALAAAPAATPRSSLRLDVDSELARAALVQGHFTACVARYAALLPHLQHADPATAGSAYMNLSVCESRLGQSRAALAHADTSVALARATFGPDHPYTLESELALETALVGAGDDARAVALLDRLVPALTQRYGSTHPVTLNAMHDLGFALTCEGHPQQGANWLRQAAVGRSKVLGANHPWTALSEGVLGMALTASGKLPAAASELAAARAALATRPGASDYVDSAVLESSADLDLAEGHADAAITNYNAALRAGMDVYPPGSPRLAMIQIGRGLALIRAGKASTGETELRSALQQLGEHADCRAGQLAAARNLLAKAQ